MNLQPATLSHNSKLNWHFPLPRIHAGIEIGNGVLGLSIWGEEKLHITLGRNGFWDHRGATTFARTMTYAHLRELLFDDREDEVRAQAEQRAETGKTGSTRRLRRPSQIGGGRMELSFPRDLRPARAELAPNGVLSLHLAAPTGEEATLDIAIALDENVASQKEIAWITVPQSLHGQIEVRLRPTWEWVHEELEQAGIASPQLWNEKNEGGFHQSLPEDPGLAIAWHDRDEHLVVATALGDEPAEVARQIARDADIAALETASQNWWHQYWNDVPSLDLPDQTLMRLWRYGLVKQAGLTTPGGVAATLQGPWMEEHCLPPWSNDFHFNINLQMIYWPCLSSNRTAHLEPLWQMMREWMPELRALGAAFFGDDDAIMLPHAVDDRGRTVDTFWHGTIDHACPSWMALLAWLHFEHSGDTSVLRDIAWPLLTGSFAGYRAMCEETAEGQLQLPISVSPEYGEGGKGFWGANASFQLAAAHMVARLLPRAAAVLGEPIDPLWADLDARLPEYAAVGVAPSIWDSPGRPPKFRIGVWDGQDLDFSHRHQSHLAGIYPFCTIDPLDPNRRELMDFTLGHLQQLGSGGWSAWAMPWVATLCARAGLADAALVWLHWLADNCENEGHNLSAGGTRGSFSTWGGWQDARTRGREEVMQLDANLGIVTALHELCVQSAEGEIRVLPSIPYRWPHFTFERIGAPGGFQISARVQDHHVREIQVLSQRGGVLRLRHGLGQQWLCDGEKRSGDVFEIETSAGQRLILSPAT